MSVKPMAGFDMDNRDPNNLNEHLQVIVENKPECEVNQLFSAGSWQR
jgi:hypothetical protein